MGAPSLDHHVSFDRPTVECEEGTLGAEYPNPKKVNLFNYGRII